jgi:hypothetical protein
MIDDSKPWRAKLLKTIETNYRRAPGYAAGIDILEQLINAPESNLAHFNIAAIRRIAERLGVEARFLLQSNLRCEGHATELLISITKAVGANAYLVGGGSGGYQDDDAFAAAGVTLHYQNFRPQPYGAPDNFLPGLSVIDYLMRDGRPLTEAFADRSGQGISAA